MHWALWLAILVLALFLLTNHGAPWLVRRLSSNVRIRNIGLRSVRGLFLKIGPVTLTADRIALTVHRSPGGARVGLDFVNIVVTVSKILKPATPAKRDHWRTLRQNYKRDFSIASIASIIHQRSSISQLSFPRWIMHQIASTSRTVFRYISTYGLVVLIRWLPALTQKFDTHFDQVVIIVEDLGGAHLVVKGLTLAALLKFTKLADHDAEDGLELTQDRKSAIRMAPQGNGLRRKWKDSMGRVWDRATARTTGFASLAIDVGDIIAYPTKATPLRIASYRSTTSPTSFNFTSTGVADFTSIERAPPVGSCLSVEGPIELQASVGFSPKRMVFRKRSGEAKINLPCVQLMPDVILQLVQRLKPTTAESPVESTPGSPVPEGSGSAWGPITFSPPGSPELGPQITVSRWSRLRRRKETTVPLPQVLFAILKGIEINVPEFHARIKGVSEIDAPDTYYSVKNQGFLVRLQLSEPSTSVLHQKWLGNSQPPGSKHEVNVYAVTFQSRCSVVRRLASDSAKQLTLARIGEVLVETVVTGWPAPWLMPPQIFSTDPNAAFVAVEAIVDNLELAEHIEVIKWLLKNRNPPKEKPPSGAVIHPVPKINVRFALNHPSLRLIEQTSEATTFITTRTEGLNLEVQSTYSHRKSDQNTSHVDGTPVTLEYFGTARLAPVSVTPHESSNRPTLSQQMSSLSVLSSDSMMGSIPTPLVALGAVDVIFKGTAFGCHKENGSAGVALDRSTALTDVRVLVDSLLVDLTRLQWLPLIIRTFGPTGESTLKPPDMRPKKAVLDNLPCGLSIHMSLPSLHVGLAGQGISVDNNVVTSRGLALESSIVVDYCYLSCPDHTSRLKAKTTKAAMRDRLGLPQEPVHAASSLAQDAHNKSGKAAFGQVVVSQTTVRSIIDDNTFGWLDTDLHDGPFTAGEDTDAHLLLRVPEISGTLTLRRDQAMEPSGGLVDSCRTVVRIPRTSGRFDLHHIYCALAVLSMVKKFAPPRKPADAFGFATQRTPLPPPAIDLATAIEVHADVFQIVGVLPRSSKVFLRLTGFVATQKPTKERSFRFITGCLWTPSREPVAEGEIQKWDELCRLTSWSGSFVQTEVFTSPRPSISISLVGNGARLRIPHRFILSELVTDIALAVKASKHLAQTVPTGTFYPMPKPPTESAKKVPSINLMIESLALEIADDPFEAKLNLIWRQGVEEQISRLQREEAFAAKVAAIKAAEEEAAAASLSASSLQEPMSASHTVGIEEARERLDLYNSINWIRRHKQARDALIGREETVSSRIREPSSRKQLHASLPFEVRPNDRWPPLLRSVLSQVRLSLEEPPFKEQSLPDFMFEQGGLPRDTQFTLLVPLRLQWSMDNFRVTLRDYPIPLLEVPHGPSSWTCNSTVVVAEELGPDESIDWFDCRIKSPLAYDDPAPISFAIPKTIMPVKSYANPEIKINGAGVTDLAWAVSYTPGIQDVMRVFDTFSASPRDKSPPLGFWDKLRLILHWKVRVLIEGETRLHIKGSRDPYYISGAGAGFVLCFKGDTDITVGYSAKDKELLQISSSKLFMAIPDLSRFKETVAGSRLSTSRKLVKVCAKLTNGVRLGFGFALERTCYSKCSGCGNAPAFSKKCRFFTFKPHYEVALKVPPKSRGPIQDSFEGFRSNFIHFSISLTSPVQPKSADYDSGFNSFHLSPKTFAHFFAWWSLFGSSLNLPIRQGKLYPDARAPSPKFGRHIATIKYRISFSPLFISHMYKQDAIEQWREGETGFVGVKAKVESLRADLHQREQAIVVLDKFSGLPKTITHKPFAAAEVVISNMELRSVYALFADSRKSLVPLFQSGSLGGGHSSYAFPEDRCEVIGASEWTDMEDFNETDWTPFDEAPRVWMFRAATCPQFTFFRTISSETSVGSERVDGAVEKSKFGDEDTHICTMSKRETLRHVQITLTKNRLQALHEQLQRLHEQTSGESYDSSISQDAEPSYKARQLKQSIERLQDYLDDMLGPGTSVPPSATSGSFSREGPAQTLQSTITTPSDWEGFNNVYEVHSPQIIFSNSTRNILLDYYYSSRNRRGFEYHMSHRALKALQAQLLGEVQRSVETIRPNSNVAGAAARAATALRRILTAESANAEEHAHSDTEEVASRITQEKSHFCVLLKPQIALHNEEEEDAVVHIAAMEASLTSHTLVDPDYLDDAVNSYVMRRHKVKLHGMQAFVPTVLRPDSELYGVPLEILVDFRCESGDYERLVPQTDAEFSYDKFNRLRLHNEFSNASRQSLERNSSDEYMRNQTDRVIIKIPRFTVTANSNSFRALNNIITHLILYSDPSHSRRNEALEKFLFTYDFTEASSAVDVVLTMQTRIRQLLQTARNFDLHYGSLDDNGQMDALKVQAELTSLGDKLDFIFEAIRLAQEKARNLDNNLASALQLQVASDVISYNMLGPSSNLLAKLAVKGVSFLWTNRKDSSTSNVLTIKDFQAFNGLPGATFPEILVAHPQPSSHPMVKRKLFAEAKWTVLPPVAQISVIERFELRLHPVKVQIERKIGREIQEYISPKDRRAGAIPGASFSGKQTPVAQVRDEPPVRRSSDYGASLTVAAPPKTLRMRTSSWVNLRDAERANSATPSISNGAPAVAKTLHRSASTHSLRPTLNPLTPSTPTEFGHKAVASETDEMRVRARKRTFWSIDMESFLLVLTYKGESLGIARREQGGLKARDFIPNLDEFPLTFPGFERQHCTWSVDEFLQVVKSELKKNAVGVVFRAFNARFSNKYRIGDGSRETVAEDEGGPVEPSAPAPTDLKPKSGPFRIRTLSTPKRTEPRILTDHTISTSPTTSSPPTASLDSSISSLPSAPSETDSRQPRGRTQKVLNLFRHKTKKSTDSAASSTSVNTNSQPRRSLESTSGLQRLQPLTPNSRSRSVVRD